MGSGVKAALGTLTPSVQVRILAPQLGFPSGLECEHMFVPGYRSKNSARSCARSTSLSEVLRHFGLRTAGGNHRQLSSLARRVGHLDRAFRPTGHLPRRGVNPLEAILVEHSTFSRGHLKQRLYDEGLKERECEMCGLGEEWRGRRMALILDHVNGVGDDNRIENLRIVCPNCAATLDTHCGRQNRRYADRYCPHCGESFRPGRRSSGTARAAATSTRTGRSARWPSGGWSGRRTSSWSRRWRRRGGVRSGASTA